MRSEKAHVTSMLNIDLWNKLILVIFGSTRVIEMNFTVDSVGLFFKKKKKKYSGLFNPTLREGG